MPFEEVGSKHSFCYTKTLARAAGSAVGGSGRAGERDGMTSDKPDRAKPGRPSKREVEARGRLIGFRVTEAEAARLQLAADTVGASLSAYCRAAILGARLPAQRRGRDLSGVLVELNRVGVNLNQIARTVNRGQGVPADLAEVLAEVRAVVERLADEADE